MIIPSEVSLRAPELSLDRIDSDPTFSVYPLSANLVIDSTSDVLAVEDNEYWEILALSYYNRSNSVTPTLTLYLVDDGDTAVSTNEVYRATSIASFASGVITPLIGAIIPPNSSLVGLASDASGVTVYGGVRRHFRGSFRD